MSTNINNKSEILTMLKNGKITSEEAFKMIKAIDKNKVVEEKSNISLNKVEDILVDGIVEILKYKKSKININQDFREYGFNSFTLVRYRKYIEEHLNVNIAPQEFFKHPTISAISDIINKEMGGEHVNDIVGPKKELKKEVNVLSKKVAGKLTLKQEKIWILNKSKRFPRKYMDGFFKSLKDNKEIKVQASNVSNEILDMLINDGYKFQHLLVEEDSGKKIEVISMGKGDPIVIIGGIGSTAKLVYNQMKNLSEENRVVVIHMPGTSLSEGLDDLSLDALGDMVINILDNFDIKENINIMGCSWGSLLAVTIAKNYKEKVSNIILVSPIVDLDNSKTGETPEKHMWQINEIVHEEFSSFENGEGLYSEYLEAMNLDTVTLGNYMKYFDKSYKEYYSVEGILQEVEVPVLLINGAKDLLCVERHTEILKEKLKNCNSIVIEEAGHFAAFTHWKELNEAVLKFINGND